MVDDHMHTAGCVGASQTQAAADTSTRQLPRVLLPVRSPPLHQLTTSYRVDPTPGSPATTRWPVAQLGGRPCTVPICHQAPRLSSSTRACSMQTSSMHTSSTHLQRGDGHSCRHRVAAVGGAVLPAANGQHDLSERQGLQKQLPSMVSMICGGAGAGAGTAARRGESAGRQATIKWAGRQVV